MRCRLVRPAQFLDDEVFSCVAPLLRWEEYEIFIDRDETPRSVLRALLKSIYELGDEDKDVSRSFVEQNSGDSKYDNGRGMLVGENYIPCHSSSLSRKLLSIPHLTNDMADQCVLRWLEDELEALPGHRFDLYLCVSLSSLQSRRLEIIVWGSCGWEGNSYTLHSLAYSGERLARMLAHARELIAESR